MDYPTIANPIGTRLKAEMKKRSLTSTELARRSGVLNSFLYDVISGKSSNPSTVKLAQVAGALGVDLNYLVSGSEENINFSIDDYIIIPQIIAQITADGTGSIATDNKKNVAYSFHKEWITHNLAANSTDLRMFTITGDGMSPSLCHNDTVLIDVSKKHPSAPAIFVLFDGVGLVAKRCEYIDGVARIRISSDNPQCSTYEKLSTEVTIIGRVVWFSRQI